MSSDLFAFVEIPKGSRNKYEYDEEVGGIVLDRFLFSSVVYPSDYGFIPDTLGADGDPLDALVIVTEPTFPGCTIPVKAIGIFKMTDDKGQDDKIVCIPTTDPNWTDVNDLDDLSDQLKNEISHFFEIYKQPEGKTVTIDGWDGREKALAEIETSRARWQDAGAKPIPARGYLARGYAPHAARVAGGALRGPAGYRSAGAPSAPDPRARRSGA